MNIDYQTERHLSAQQQQWPHLDVDVQRLRIRGALLSGNAWLHQESGAAVGKAGLSGQMDLFEAP